jgi:radical SAM superfamily enzyme YgiQ (UPF0313 family)
MVYKKGPPFRVRPVQEICEDILEARSLFGDLVRTVFLPAGNTIAMPTEALAAVCRFAGGQFPRLERITVYGSSQYIARKGLDELKLIREAGLTRIHVGMESGDDEILRRVKKGTHLREQITAGRLAKEAGIEMSAYVILGLGGQERTEQHARATARAINAIAPDFVRLRTLVPKIHTFLLHQFKKGQFKLLTPHQVLRETRQLIENTRCQTTLVSDHYTNYINLQGRLPDDKERMLREIDLALEWDDRDFRPHFIGTE